MPLSIEGARSIRRSIPGAVIPKHIVDTEPHFDYRTSSGLQVNIRIRIRKQMDAVLL